MGVVGVRSGGCGVVGVRSGGCGSSGCEEWWVWE